MEINHIAFLDAIDDITSKFNKIPKKSFINSGLYPIIDQGSNIIAGYTNEESVITNLGYPVIVFGDHTRIIKYIDYPFAIGADGVKVLSVNTEKAYPLYIFYFLKFLKIPNAGYSRHYKFLKEKKIALPKDIDDQKRIAKVLSECEALIQKREASIDLLDELLKSTFLEMFDYEFKKASEWETKLIDVAPSIDSGWSPICEPFPRNSDDQWAVLKLSCVTGKNFDPTKNKACLPNTFIKKALIPKKGDLLFSRKNTFALVGATAYVFDNYQNLILPDTIFKINYDPKKVNGIYLWHLLNDEHFSKKVRDLASGAAGSMPNISQNKLLNLAIPSPPLSLQNKFSKLVEKVLTIKSQFRDSLKELENLYGSISQRSFTGELDLSKVNISDMEDLKKKDLEEVKEYTTGDNEETLKNKAEFIEILENKKENDSYISKNGLLYIEKSRTLRSKIYSLIKDVQIDEVDFNHDLIEINKIGAQFHSEIQEFTPWQIDQHKSVERYIALLPKLILDEYPYINLFSSNQFDYSLMSLDEYYGIPEDIIMQYGSIEDKITDLVFFFKKYFSNKLFTIEDLEKKYNQLVYDQGDWFKYEEMKEFIFKSMDGDDALLTQSFEEVEILDIESGKPQSIKKIMLKVI